MIDFPDCRDEGTSTLRKVQLVQLRLLRIADAICRKYNLNYWIEFGTLLGAVRHHGFIPWDDDIDIAMPIEDYKKFIQTAPCELPEDVLLQLPQSRNHDYHQNIVKLIDKYSIALTSLEQIESDCLNGIYIDIFPVVQCPRIPQKVLMFFSKYLHDGYILLHLKQHISSKEILRYYYRFFGFYALKIIWFIFCVRKNKKEYIYEPTGSSDQAILSHEVIFPLREMLFEGFYFKAPNQYDVLLRQIYGNYLKEPPPEEQTGHCIVIADPYKKCDHPQAMDWKLSKYVLKR